MKRTFWGVLILEGLVGLHRTVQVQLLQHYWLGIGLDYLCDLIDYTSPWNSLGQITGVGSLSFLQGIFPSQLTRTHLRKEHNPSA